MPFKETVSVYKEKHKKLTNKNEVLLIIKAGGT
jgi:hypothetical protein